jgi:hypothetical protein
MKEVTETHEKEQDRHKIYVDKNRRPAITFQVGDQVMVKTRLLSNAAQGITAKFAPKRDGPYKIAKCISPTSYQLAKNVTGDLLAIYHVSDLEAWKGDETESQINPVRTIRRRGRPKKDVKPSPPTQVVGSSARTPDRSKGGVCNMKGPTTRSKAAALRGRSGATQAALTRPQ